MKTLIAVAICLSGAFFASSCGKSPSPEEEAAAKLEKISVSLEQEIFQHFDQWPKFYEDESDRCSASFDMKNSESIINPFLGTITIDLIWLRASKPKAQWKCTVNLQWSGSQKAWQFKDASEVALSPNKWNKWIETHKLQHDSIAPAKRDLNFRIIEVMTNPDKKILESALKSQGE